MLRGWSIETVALPAPVASPDQPVNANFVPPDWYAVPTVTTALSPSLNQHPVAIVATAPVQDHAGYADVIVRKYCVRYVAVTVAAAETEYVRAAGEEVLSDHCWNTYRIPVPPDCGWEPASKECVVPSSHQSGAPVYGWLSTMTVGPVPGLVVRVIRNWCVYWAEYVAGPETANVKTALFPPPVHAAKFQRSFVPIVMLTGAWRVCVELAFHHATIGVGVGTVSTVIEAPITFDWTSILNWWTQVAVRVFGAFIVIVVDVAKDVRSPDHRSNR